MKYYKSLEFWASLIILLVTIALSVWAFDNWIGLSFYVGDWFFVHWLSIAAAIFIAVLVPVYYVLKRKRPKHFKTLLRFHIFGNLLAFLLISIHFAQNVGRLQFFISRLADGAALFLVLSIIVATGMIVKFGAKLKFVRYLKFVHRYTVLLFYLVLIFHVVQSLP